MFNPVEKLLNYINKRDTSALYIRSLIDDKYLYVVSVFDSTTDDGSTTDVHTTTDYHYALNVRNLSRKQRGSLLRKVNAVMKLGGYKFHYWSAKDV